MNPKSFYSSKLGKRLAAKAKNLEANKYHIILSDDRHWAVVPDGSKRALKIFSTQPKAVEFAKKAARNLNGEVVVHKETGEIQELINLPNLSF